MHDPEIVAAIWSSVRLRKIKVKGRDHSGCDANQKESKQDILVGPPIGDEYPTHRANPMARPAGSGWSQGTKPGS